VKAKHFELDFYVFHLFVENKQLCFLFAKDKTSDGAARSRAAGPGAAAVGARRLLGGVCAAARVGGAAAADGDAPPLLVAAAQPGRGRRHRRHSAFASVVGARPAWPAVALATARRVIF
jgi:hypothetical protein